MKFLILILFFFTSASAQNFIYDFENKKIKNKYSNFRIHNDLGESFDGTYEVFLLGKKNDLNNELIELDTLFEKKIKDEQIEDNKFKTKQIFINNNDRYIIDDKNSHNVNKKKIYNQEDFYNLPKTNLYSKKNLEYQIFKKFSYLKSIKFLNNYFNIENKWQYSEINDDASKNYLIQKILNYKTGASPILRIKNLNYRNLKEINFRLKIKYNENDYKEIILPTDKQDWIVIDNVVYLSIHNLITKKFYGYENDIDKISFKEIYIHLKINDKLSNKFFNLIDISILNLDKIYFEKNLIIYNALLIDKLSSYNINIVETDSINQIFFKVYFV